MIASTWWGRHLAGLAASLLTTPLLTAPLLTAPLLTAPLNAAPRALARTAAAGACPALSSGVTLVVDFSAFGGGVTVSCVSGDPGSGLAVLESVYPVGGTAQYGKAFVCRINGLPGASESCAVTPKPPTVWAYWHASRGGSWTFSAKGAADYDPAAGSVEGWAFGAGVRPGIAPPAAAPPPPAGGGGTTTTPPSTGGSNSGGSGSGGSGGSNTGGSGAGGGTGGGGSGQVGGATARPGGTPSPTVSGMSTSDASAGTATSSAPAAGPVDPAGGAATDAAPPTDSGTPVGTLVAIGLIILLAGAGAGAALLRRRRTSPLTGTTPSDEDTTTRGTGPIQPVDAGADETTLR